MARAISAKCAFESKEMEVLSAIFVHRKAEAASAIGSWLVPSNVKDPACWALERLERLRMEDLVSIVDNGDEQLWVITSKGLKEVERMLAGGNVGLLSQSSIRAMRRRLPILVP